jgi:hypothetical protein
LTRKVLVYRSHEINGEGDRGPVIQYKLAAVCRAIFELAALCRGIFALAAVCRGIFELAVVCK